MENRWDGSETEANHEMEIMTYILDSLCPEEQPDVRHPQLPNTKPLPSVESLGPPPPKPPRPPVVTLQAFQRQAAALSKPNGEGKETHTHRPVHSQPREVMAPMPPSLYHLPPLHQLPGDSARLLFCGAGHPSLLILI